MTVVRPMTPVPDRFTDQLAVVTGGARGMGAAQARRLVAEGAKVVIFDLLADEGRELVESLGTSASYVEVDVADEKAWARGMSQAAEFAGMPPTVVLHNAGIATMSTIEETSREDFARVIDVNLVGSFLAVRSSIGPMTEAGHGAIVINSSLHGLASHQAFASYCASKAGMLGLVRTAALELGSRGIRVNAIAPGVIDTPRTRPPDTPKSALDPLARQVPLGRVGEPEDAASVALFLASADSGYVTGTTFVLDGGLMAQLPLVLSGAQDMDLGAG